MYNMVFVWCAFDNLEFSNNNCGKVMMTGIFARAWMFFFRRAKDFYNSLMYLLRTTVSGKVPKL